MHARRLNRIAHYLGSAGLYKEASQLKKLAQGRDDEGPPDQDLLDILQRWKPEEERQAEISTRRGLSKLYSNPQSPDDEGPLDDEGPPDQDLLDILQRWKPEEEREREISTQRALSKLYSSPRR